MDDLLKEIDQTIAAYEQKRSELLFELGKVNGALEMAKTIRVRLVATSREADKGSEENQ